MSEQEKSGQGPLAGILTEEELKEILGVSKEQLSSLRNYKQLPFVPLSSRKRIYLESDLMSWFKGLSMALNKG